MFLVACLAICVTHAWAIINSMGSNTACTILFRIGTSTWNQGAIAYVMIKGMFRDWCKENQLLGEQSEPFASLNLNPQNERNIFVFWDKGAEDIVETPLLEKFADLNI